MTEPVEHVPTFRVVARSWPDTAHPEGRLIRQIEFEDPYEALVEGRKLFKLGLLVHAYESTADGKWTAAYDIEPPEMRPVTPWRQTPLAECGPFTAGT